MGAGQPDSTPPVMGEIERKSLLDLLTENVAPLATGAAGLAYIFGVWEVSQVAEGLGISSSDFGLDFRDYALLAAVALLPFLLILVAIPFGQIAYFLVQRVERGSFLRARVLFQPHISRLATAAIYGFFVLLILLSVFAAGNLDVIVFAILAFAAGFLYEVRSSAFFPLRLLIVVGLYYLAFSLLLQPIASSRSWSEDVRQWVAAGANSNAQPDTPRGLGMVLEPNPGLAWIESDVDCVVRMGDVLIGRETVVVVKSLDRFISASCTPEARPFGD